MLIQFSVTNFLSFKEKQTFSSLATTDTRLTNKNLATFKNKNYSKLNVFYGANASGKSAFCYALSFVAGFIYNSNFMMDNKIIPVMPFKFDEATKNAPSEFEFIFTKNETKYSYSFSCDRNAVYTECLEIYENDKPKLVFERSEIDKYKFTSYKNELNDIVNKNTKNKLFLCTSANWNFEPCKPVVDFLLNDLVIDMNDGPLDDNNSMITIIEKFQEDGCYEDYKKFCLNLLSMGDFNIVDFDIEINKKEISELPADIQNVMATLKALPHSNVNNILKQLKLTALHSYEVNGENHIESLNFAFESLGTRALFKFAPELYDVLKYGKVLVMDEIDRSLHPLLVKYIVSLFASEKNTSNAQLICNTHDVNLLDLDLIRRDEIWFAEKDVRTGASDIYPLTDFSPRVDENIEKGYLLGRYGAIPFITEKGDLWAK